MHAKFFAMVCSAALLGCATPPGAPPEAVMAGVQARVVTAHDAAVGRGPSGVANRFTLNGKMVAYVVLTWPEAHDAWGTQTFESRWYHADHLVVKRETNFKLMRSPFHFWSSVYPVALGPGKGRYEVYANGKKLAETSFEVLDSPAGSEAPPLGRQTDLSAEAGASGAVPVGS